jgi:chemotaxis protein methyltransferase CheR
MSRPIEQPTSAFQDPGYDTTTPQIRAPGPPGCSQVAHRCRPADRPQRLAAERNYGMIARLPSPELNPVPDDMFAVLSQSVSEADFALFQRLIERETGIYLAPVKKALLVGRLACRLRQLGLGSLRDYYKRVTADPDERVQMIDRISTNETQFFRGPLHFDFLANRALPEWCAQETAGQRPRHIRVWSAGCSTGEEPYSIAMTLLDRFPPSSGWRIEILATDLSTRVLEKARSGLWPLDKSNQIPPAYLKSFMLRGTGSQEGTMKAGPELRQVVRFERLNMLDEATDLRAGPFDLIFCRNVLIYFQPATKAQVVRRLLDQLVPDGYLFVGHSESLNHLTERVRTVVPTVYALSAAGQG